MAISNLKLITRPGHQDPLSDPRRGWARKIADFSRLLMGYVRGMVVRNSETMIRRGLVRAFGSVAFSGASGTVGAIINGVTLTFAHGASDQADSNTLVANINASTNPLVQYLVEAGNLSGTLTFVSAGGGLTVDVCGFKFRSVLTATPAGVDEFTVAGTDTADAASLAAAINEHPVANHFLRATNSAGVVTVWCTRAALPAGFSARLVGATGITAGAAALAAGTTVFVTHLDKGETGNQATIAASGTGVTASGARLTGGTSSFAVTN